MIKLRSVAALNLTLISQTAALIVIAINPLTSYPQRATLRDRLKVPTLKPAMDNSTPSYHAAGFPPCRELI
jgi:hypothetical protein